MSKYRVQITQYSNDAEPRTLVEEVYTTIVDADSADQAEAKVRADGEPSGIDADVEVLGEVTQ
jgi:hypothetical protein